MGLCRSASSLSPTRLPTTNMPRKRGGSRGGSRGSSRGGSRGGGSFGRFNLSKSLKRRSKSKANKRDMPELMDLNESVYIPEINTELPRASMKSLSKRPNRYMMDEARFTDRNIENTMKQPLRRRPIEFVKAQQSYDPSKELIDKLRLLSKCDPLVKDMEQLNVEERQMTLADLRDIDGSDIDGSEFGRSDIEDDIVCSKETALEDLQDLEQGDGQHVEVELSTTEVIGNDGKDINMGEVNVEVTEKVAAEIIEEQADEDKKEEEELCDADIETVELQDGQELEDEEKDEQEEIKVELEKEEGENEAEYKDDEEENEEGANEPEDEDDGEEDEIYSDSGMSDAFVIDAEGDDLLLDLLNTPKLTTKEVIKQHRERPKNETYANVGSEIPVAHLEYDPYLSVGKVMLKTHVLADGSVETFMPSSKKINVGGKGFKELSPEYFEEESEDTDEEAAFEDYMSQLMQANAMDDDFDLGSDIDVSSQESDHSGVSDIDSDYSISDEEGLEDILSLARNQQNSFSNLDIGPTQSLKKKGKGKNSRLDIGDEIEMELRASLIEQFQYQRQSRKLKKLRKKEKLEQEASNSNDLSVKYDYMLHIKEIKQEFETLLHDASRESMSFPPLDGHGNKTLSKLAKHYNMKCTRCGGNGLRMYMKVSKTRKTFHYLPDYNQINYIMRQRPVFKRADVKARTKEEISETDSKKGRQGPKNDAYVREGDIVGGKAPEIGANNIGRQLLEKLGWVKGEGLGAHGNKGISEPLLATVKKSKTGLK